MFILTIKNKKRKRMLSL